MVQKRPSNLKYFKVIFYLFSWQTNSKISDISILAICSNWQKHAISYYDPFHFKVKGLVDIDSFSGSESVLEVRPFNDAPDWPLTDSEEINAE